MAKKKKIDWDKFYSAYKNMKRVGNGTYRKLDIEGLGMVMDALQRKGFNDRQIEAILGNVVEESGGDPFAIAKDGVYKGLFQESNVRYPMNEFNKDKKRFKGKKKEYIDYMIDRFYEHVNDSKYYTVKGTKYNRAKEAVKEFTSNGKNVDYSYPLVYAFEAPGDKEGTYKNRKSVSNIISKSYANDGSYEPSVAVNNAEPKQNTNNNGFGAAFKEAKNKGLSEFVFNGKKYSTAVKEDGGLVLDDVVYMEDGGNIGLLDWIKKQDFAGRGKNLIKAILDPKGSVYKIMSNSGGKETMSLPEVIDILSKDTEGKYKGKSFDFPKMYIYGNDESAEELTDEEKGYGVDYSSYLNGRGIDPKTIKQYKGDFGYDIELPESLKENIINLIESGNNPTIGFEEFFSGVDEIEHDDVGGHLGRINMDPDGNLFMSYSDIWDFEPKFYSDFHNDPDLIGNKALSYVQSYLLDKVGTPFIVRSKKQIKFVPDKDYGSKVEDDDAFRYSEETVGAIKDAIEKISTRTANSSDQGLQEGGPVSDDNDKWYKDEKKRESIIRQQNSVRKNQKNFIKLEKEARKALEDGDIDEDEYRKIIGFSEDQIGNLIIEKSGEGEKVAEMINEMLNSGIDESAFANGVGDAAKSQEEKRLDSLYDYKLIGNSLLTLAEIASASPAVLRILRSNGVNLAPILEKIADNKKIQIISGLTGMASDTGQIILNPDDGNITNYLGIIGNAAELLSGTKVGTKVGERLFGNYDRETANDVFDLINTGISAGGIVGNMSFEDGGDIKQKHTEDEWDAVNVLRRDNTNVLNLPPEIILSEEIGKNIPYEAGSLPEVVIKSDLTGKKLERALNLADARRGRNYVYQSQNEIMDPILETVNNPAVQLGLSFAPIVGSAMDIQDLMESIKEGHPEAIALASVGLIPWVGDLTKDVSQVQRMKSLKGLSGREALKADYDALAKFKKHTSDSKLPPFGEIKSGEQLDELFKKEIERHRSVVRGVISDEENVEKYLFSLAPAEGKAGRYGTRDVNIANNKGYTYTSNSREQALGYSTNDKFYNGKNGYIGRMMIGQKLDYTSNDRLEWLKQADFDFDISDKSVLNEFRDQVYSNYEKIEFPFRDRPIMDQNKIDEISNYLIKRSESDHSLDEYNRILNRKRKTYSEYEFEYESTKDPLYKSLMNNTIDYIRYLEHAKKTSNGDKVKFVDSEIFFRIKSKVEESNKNRKLDKYEKMRKFIDEYVDKKYTPYPKKGIILGGMGKQGQNLMHFIIKDENLIHPVSIERVIDKNPYMYTRAHSAYASDDLSGKIFEDGGDIKQKQKKAYDYFTMKRGMSQIQALAILGNLMAESELKDDMHGDNGTSYGIQQWHNERKDALFKMAKKKGHDAPTFEDQLEFLADEYEGKTGYSNFLYARKGKMGPGYYNYSRSDFQDAENLRDAVVAWNQGAGRPHKSVIRNDDRYSAALKVAKNLGFDFGLDAGAAPMYGQMGIGEDFIFHEEGEEPTGDAQPVPDAQAVSPQDTVSTTQEDMMKSWIEAYGKGIVAQLMATSGNNKVNTSVDDTTERYRDYIKESKDDEDSKRMALLQSFLPNIQLKIKGVTQVRGDQ